MKLVLELPDDPILVDADRVKTVQIVTNLVSNGIKYTERGTVTVAVCQTSDDASSPSARISIKDTGVGIKQDDLARLFKRFSQLDSTTTRPVGGTSLGLFISAKYVHMHGGKIDVESELGVGSTFTVTMPRRPNADAHEPSAREPASTPPSSTAGNVPSRQPTGGLTILCVDDDPDVRRLMKLTFEDSGYRAMLADSYEAAIIQAKRCRPDLICLDLRMPGKDGHALMEAFRADDRLQAVPIIVVSGQQDTLRAVNDGARCCLQKPVDTQELLDKVHDILAEQLGDVLVVDDDADTIKLVTEVLAERGIQVRTAVNGADALQQLREWSPAVIVCDLLMPIMDGFTLLEKLQDNPIWRTIPVIILTVKTLSPEESARLEQFCNAILVKGKDDALRLVSTVLQSGADKSLRETHAVTSGAAS